jgi:uncharacterized protein (TIGR03437 family)
MDIDQQAFISGEGPRHLLFNLNNDVYVLPSAFILTQQQPPVISQLAPGEENGSKIVTITGTGLKADTRVTFDGVAGVVTAVDDVAGTIKVIPPPAPAGQRVAVVAINTDGQSSLFMGGDVPVYTYEGELSAAVPPSLTVRPASLPAGTEGMVEIEGVGVNFVDGQTAVGFGTSDVTVQRVWVLSPTKLMANVAVGGSAQAGSTTVTAVSGLDWTTQASGFQVTAPSTKQLTISTRLQSAAGQGLIPGSVAVATAVTTPVPLASATLSIFVNERQAQLAGLNGNQISFTIPQATPVGAAVIRVDINGERGLPVIAVIEPPLVQITGATVSNRAVDAVNPARAGDLLTLSTLNLAEAGANVNASRITVSIGGTELPALQVLPNGSTHFVAFFIPANVPTGTQVPVTITINGRTSAPYSLNIR